MKLHEALDFAQRCLTEGRKSEADRLYKEILNRDPNNSGATFGLGNIAMGEGEHGLAANLYRRAVELNPNNLSAMLNLAPSLRRCGKVQSAIEVHELVEEILSADTTMDPAYRNQLRADNFGNWSGCYVNDNSGEKCWPIADRALELDPNNANANNHKALSLLEHGRWSEAWPHWEKRVKRPQFHKRQFGADYWDGQPTDVLAVHGEQGVGDEVMFASALEDAKAKCGQVVVECERRLVPVFERSFGVPCYPSPEALMSQWAGKITAKTPLGSLIAHARKSPEDCPGTPYMKANPDLVAFYKERLSRLEGTRKVGIAWHGGTPGTHETLRNLPLSQWSPILSTPDVAFVSLQYGERAAPEADVLGVQHWFLANDDLERQFALIEALDLVITVTQSVVHFAGALGKPCWALTPSKFGWRYGGTTERMWLYKSVRLYRQDTEGNWPVERLAKDLSCF